MKRISSQPKLLAKRNSKVKSRKIKTRSRNSNSFYKKIESSNGRARVLVIRALGGIGDVLMTLPALRELKRRFPKIELTYAVDMHSTKNNVYYELVKNLHFIDKIVDARFVNRKQYDASKDISAVCIAYERKDLPDINRIDLFARALGLTSLEDYVPPLHLESAEKKWADNFLKKHDVPEGHKLVALHTASFDAKRTWPAYHYQWLLDNSVGLPITYLVIDFNNKIKKKNEFDNIINCSGTNLRQMAALINRCDLFVGPDSGPMHIAGALRKQSLVFFGSIPPQARINYYKFHEAITSDIVKCLGCWYAKCDINIECMRSIKGSRVLNLIKKKLGVKNG